MAKAARRRPMSEINVVPYIDVMLVLLVIFMVTTPLLTQGVEVDLPQAVSDAVKDPDVEPFLLVVDRNGQLLINEEKEPSAGEEIIRQAGDKLTVKTGQTVLAVSRHPGGVRIECSNGVIEADKVIFATPPDQVLCLLTDATDEERLWFSNWQANHAETVIHTDESIYADWAISGFTEFDLFEKGGGRDAGYNAWLNRLSGLPNGHNTNYFLAFNLEDRIDPRKILDRQQHHTPRYNARAAAYLDEIKAGNGRNSTCHAGAYLYNGLHEGAIQSALAIKSLFGV